MKNINFTALAKAVERLDDSDDGMSGRCGNWELGLGGYDHGYEIYYRGAPIGRVNYELGEYELYDEDFIPKDQIPEFLAALDARRFKDVGYHEGDDEYIDDDSPRYVQESRKQIMWAINFRNMRTAVHGMYYGKDRKRVEEFAKELEYIQKDCLDVPSDEYPFLLDDLFTDYPDIKCEEEIDWHDIVDLPGGYEGIETDDTIYRFVNRTSIDVYNESTSKQKMKFRKIVKESEKFDKWEYRELIDRVEAYGRACKHVGYAEGAWGGTNKGLEKSADEAFSKVIDFASKFIVSESTKRNNKMKFKKIVKEAKVDKNTLKEAIRDYGKACENYGKSCVGEQYSSRDEQDSKSWADEMLRKLYRLVGLSEYDESSKKIVKEADGMGMSYDELMAKFLEIQKKLGKKSQNTFVYWTYEPMDEGVQEYLDSKGYEPMGTWYSVQYSSGLCWPTGAWLGSKHEKTRRATSVQELCDWFEKNQEKLGGRKFIGALSGYEKVNDIKIENGRVVVVFGKTEDVITEGDEGYASDTPKIYVGTYAKYNDGSIDGKWITISDYNTYEEFVDACRQLHSDEDDPEFMVQDYENFPEKWYHEGGLPTEEEFDKINEFYMMDDDEKGAYEAYVDLDYGDDDIEAFRERYIGKFSSMSDFGYYLVENYGMPSENIDWYFDYDSFGRDLTMDWHQGDPDEKDYEGESEDPDYYYDGDGEQMMPYGSDQEVAEQWVDDMGGVEQLGKETIDNYFDYEEFGRIVFDNDCSESNGYVFWSH